MVLAATKKRKTKSTSSVVSQEEEEPVEKKLKINKGFWSIGLLETMKDPKNILQSDDKITLICDKFPKARKHFLVISNEDIKDLKSVTAQNLPLLKHAQKMAKNYVEKNHPELKFLFGFHAVPSMDRLHMHVISEDFDSTCVKTKKHWNSFTTKFFINSTDVIEQLEKNGELNLGNFDEELNKPLKCHKCETYPKNMPKLKEHILTHII